MPWFQVGQIAPILQFAEDLINEIGPVVNLLEQVRDEIPVLRKLLDNPCGATDITDNLSGCGLEQQMALVAQANETTNDLIHDEIDHLQATLEPVIDDVLATWNKVVDAAQPIKQLGARIPGLINELAYGDLGSIIGTAESLEELAVKLTNAGNKGTAINAAIEKRFLNGAGYPYGPAQGEGVITSAQYKFTLDPSGTSDAPNGVKLGFAVLLLLIGAGGGTALYMRNQRAV